jgi:hypothetical protein
MNLRTERSPQVLCLEAQHYLEKLGAKHAPIQVGTEDGLVYGREVTLRDPPGAYFLLGTDVGLDGAARVQLLFLGVPDTSDVLVEGVPGWRIVTKDEIPSPRGPVRTAIIEPADRKFAA